MTERSLQVDPTHLQRGADRFDQHHGDLVDIHAKIRTAHEYLQGTWSGAAADTVHEIWEDLDPPLGTHIGRIALLADGLKSGAATYVSAEDDNATGIRTAAGTEA